MISEILLLCSSGVLGIFLGAQIAEAGLLVPYWKTLKADDFFQFYQRYGKKIQQFFAPITIIATVVPLMTTIYHLINQQEHQLLLGLMGISTLAFFSSYFLYFKKANKRFSDRNLPNEILSAEITRWGNWHWGRICFEGIAFICSLLLLIGFR